MIHPLANVVEKIKHPFRRISRMFATKLSWKNIVLLIEASAISLSYVLSLLRKKTSQVYNVWIQGYQSGIEMVQTNKKLTRLSISEEAKKINSRIGSFTERVDKKQSFKK